MAKPILIDDVMSPKIGQAISTRLIVEDFVNRYNKMMKDIKFHAIKDKEDYICHILIPSEKNNEYEHPVYYNVVFQFYPLSKTMTIDNTIKNYGVRAFSNNPTFIFNFTYVYAHNDGIPNFVPKAYYSEQALKDNPKTTNPLKLFGIDRSLFTALYHIQLVTGFRKNRIDLVILDKQKPADLLKNIMGQQEKLDEIALEEKKIRLKRQGEKKTKAKEKAAVKTKKQKQDALLSKLNNSKKLQKIEKEVKDSGLKKNFTSSLNKNPLKK